MASLVFTPRASILLTLYTVFQEFSKAKTSKLRLKDSGKFSLLRLKGLGHVTVNKAVISMICIATHMNKGRFCNTIASVALVHTSIQSD